MKCRDNSRRFLILAIEFRDSITGFPDTRLNAQSMQSIQCLLWNGHFAIVAGTDNQHVRRAL
jgi:hypothetical protein